MGYAAWLLLGLAGIFFAVILGCVVKNRLSETGSFLPKTPQEFFLAGRKLPQWVVITTYLGTFNSSLLLIGIPSLAHKKGAIAVFEFWLSIVLGFLLAYFVAKKFWVFAKKHDLVSPIELLSKAHNSKNLGCVAAIFFIIPLLSYLSMQLASLGIFLEGISNGHISYFTGVGAVAIILLFYSLLGGMRAIAMTDILQVVAIYIGIICIAVLILFIVWPAEGITWQSFFEHNNQALSLNGVNGQFRFAYILFGALGLCPIIFQPQLFSRWMMASKASQPWKMNLMVVTALAFAFPMMILMALTASIVLPDLPSSNAVAGAMLHHIQSTGLVGSIVFGLFSLGVLGAAMSTADSLMMAIGKITTRDVLNTQSPSKQILVAKLVMLLSLGAAFVIGVNPPAFIADLAFYAIKATAAIVPAYLGIFWIKRHAYAAILSIIVGLVGLFLMIYVGVTPFDLSDGFITLLTSSIVYVTISYVCAFFKDLRKESVSLV